MLAGIGSASAMWAWRLQRAVRRVRAAERRARSAERMADLGAMTGGLAHEIKNPLSTVGLNAQLIAEAAGEISTDGPTDPDVRTRLLRRAESLKREAERLKGILQDFLEYAGALRLDRRSADVNQLVDELVDFFLPQAEQNGVRLRADRTPGRLPAFVDGAALKQALLNLMLNAVQAFPPRDQAGSAPREIIIKTARTVDAEKSPLVVLHVIDTGPGIAPDMREKIFQPYVTTKPGGSGLGLPTTKRLVEAHGGRVDVFSEVGRGTDFVVTLPGE
jgi:signal transduction histidine kinase